MKDRTAANVGYGSGNTERLDHVCSLEIIWLVNEREYDKKTCRRAAPKVYHGSNEDFCRIRLSI